MGIPRLYTHLRPYARPESFPPAAVSPSTALYIDGPGLAHHVYHLAQGSARPAAENPWESAVAYGDLQAAVVAYLDLLTAAGSRIYFDGHLPPAKRPTRLSRLCDSLHRLQAFHSAHPHALPGGGGGGDISRDTAPHTPSLSAPPFILAATIQILSAHARYSHAARSVPDEADAYCARDAIATGGLVLTGDSDLLLFGGAESTWGVMMFRDVHVDAARVTARVFRPTQVAQRLCVDLTLLGFLVLQDPYVSIGALAARAAVIDEDAWREFAAAYVLPPAGSDGGRGVDPRIAEILQQQQQCGDSSSSGTKTMFLPFLWEDPTRGSAWDAGRRIRAAAYSLLFPRGARTEEVCRRGRRIAAGAVAREEDPAGVLGGLRIADGDAWWARVALDEITAVFEARGQEPPERALMLGVARMLAGPGPGESAAAGRWTWERIQVYAMAQAVWYSLLLLKEVLSSTGFSAAAGDWHALPGVAECIDGARFLAGVAAAAAVLGKRPGETEGVGKRKRRKAKKREAVVEEGRSDGNMFSALA